MADQFESMMTALWDLEREAVAEIKTRTGDDARAYLWRPRGQIELPCLYNWMGVSQATTHMERVDDDFEILLRIAVQHTDVDEEMVKLMRYVDCVLDTIDVALNRPRFQAQGDSPLAGTIQRGERRSLRPIQEEFNGVPVLAMEMPLSLRVQRSIR